MKKYFNNILAVATLFTLLVFSSCESETELSDFNSAAEYNRNNNEFLKTHIPKLSGRWKVAKMLVGPSGASTFIKEDTVLLDVGVIDIRFTDKGLRGERLEFAFDLDFYIKHQIIPVKSYTVFPFYKDKKISTSISVDAKYFPRPVMSWDELPTEYHFLADYFLGDNYDMSLSEDEKTWIWKGYNGSTEEMVLTRAR